MSNKQSSISIGLIPEVFSSEFTPRSCSPGVANAHAGASTSSLNSVRHTEDDNLLRANRRPAALPENY